MSGSILRKSGCCCVQEEQAAIDMDALYADAAAVQRLREVAAEVAIADALLQRRGPSGLSRCWGDSNAVTGHTITRWTMVTPYPC